MENYYVKQDFGSGAGGNRCLVFKFVSILPLQSQEAKVCGVEVDPGTKARSEPARKLVGRHKGDKRPSICHWNTNASVTFLLPLTFRHS